LVVFTQNETDLGNYPLELCASDGYAISVCAAFTLSVEDPLKASKDDQKVKKIRAAMAITKVGRDGVLTLTFFAQYGSLEVANAIDN
jgi:hypothetical protein